MVGRVLCDRGSTRRAALRRRPLRFEGLESRSLLSAAGLDELAGFVARPAAVYSPAQIGEAYQFSGLQLANGVPADGAGQTIAIVVAYDHPTAWADLKTFNARFGLPDPPSFKKVSQTGGSRLPRADASWAIEAAMDVQWAHAVAPKANILLVEANSNRLNDLLAAVDYARKAPGVTVVSMSWGTSEFVGEKAYDSYFTTPAGHAGVTFVAASGDTGSRTTWPSVSTNVIAVGGTRLTADDVGNYQGETGWTDSGGGRSPYISVPSWQKSVQSSTSRTTPDVAYNADPGTGFYVYNSYPAADAGWHTVGGTSAGTPQWAGLIAIANQVRKLNGRAALQYGPAALYAIDRSNYRDISSTPQVSSGKYSTAPGYDLVTGLGSPIAVGVINDLARLSMTVPKTVSSVTAVPVYDPRRLWAAAIADGDATARAALAAAVWTDPSLGAARLAATASDDAPARCNVGDALLPV